MKYGYFDDKNKEYVITSPDTPLPWINYLGTDNFFGLISNTGGGYSFYKDAKLMRLTRFRYNGVPEDGGGRMIYVADGGEVWSPCFLPAKTTLDFYECRHGLGYTAFRSRKSGLEVSALFFVPAGYDCELSRISVKNNTDTEKKLSLYNVREWCLWNAEDDQTNFQRNYSTGEVEIESDAIYHKTEYRERRNHFAYFASSVPFDGFDTDRRTFLGRFNGWDTPVAVAERTSYRSIASGWSPIACGRYDLTLAAGEEKSIVFLLGYAENAENEKFTEKGVVNKTKARAVIDRFSTDEAFFAAFDELKEYWARRTSRFNVHSGTEEFDRMVNVWNQYQCMATFNLSRSASYYESGLGRGMGFRDSCQDLLGGLLVIPKERVRERIIDIASIQFEDGSTYHQYQPLTKRGNANIGQGFNDDPLWLVACVCEYVKETGDASILEAPVPFDNRNGSEVPLFAHLRASIRYTLTHLGPHGLPLIGRADWNDCLNLNCFSKTPGESFQTCSNYESGVAESVFIAGMFVRYGREYAELCRRFGDAGEGAEILESVKRMENAVLEHGWDGKWFLRAYDAFGKKVGGSACEEGKIYIEPQGFCVMAGIGGKKYGEAAMKSVKALLLNDYGVEILTPCYTEYHLELGEVSSYPPGYKENGAVFCHNNPWIIFACATIGDGEGAYDIYRRICPAFIEDKSDVHKTEPYVFSQMVAGRAAKNYGEAKNSWLTGTASWTLCAATQAILGIYAGYDGLTIRPCLPASMKTVRITRVFRDCEYEIVIENGGEKTPCVYVDGEKIDGCTVAPSAGGKRRVKVVC